MKKNEVYDVIIESYNSEAEGVARIDGRAVFVPYAKIGECHKIQILKVTNTAIWARSLEKRIETDCPYYYRCGGCSCRHMSYEEELEFKLQRVNDALLRIGKQTVKAEAIIPSDNIFRYRNKAIFNFNGDVFGFYRQRSHDLVEIDDCLLQSELSISCAKEIAKLNNPYIRNVFVRDTVCTIVASESVDAVNIPGLTGEVLCLNKGRENSILNGEYQTLYGCADLEEHLCGMKFVISPQSFFQINPSQAEKLYSKAIDYAGKGKKVLELYCGTGTISLLLSKNFECVVATEIVPEAVENAKVNASINNVSNIEFLCKDASEISIPCDTVVVDPPRKGMSLDAVEAVKRCNPEKIVYVSCNPATLARDILFFNKYELTECTVFDMFPRTKHVETVVLLCKK